MGHVASPFIISDDPLTGKQVTVNVQGNPNLQPETSMQASVGVRWEPSRRFSLGADFWQVKIKNTFGLRPTDQLLSSPLREQFLRTEPNGELILDSANTN
jgi:outer membrane receptor protein involved in Fe transport